MTREEDDKAFRYPIIFGAKYVFKCAEILFKVLSWLILVIAFRVISQKVDSSLLRILVSILSQVYFLTIFFCCFALLTAYREEMGLEKDKTGLVLAIIIKIASIALLTTMVNPRFPLDNIVDRLTEIQISK